MCSFQVKHKQRRQRKVERSTKLLSQISGHFWILITKTENLDFSKVNAYKIRNFTVILETGACRAYKAKYNQQAYTI